MTKHQGGELAEAIELYRHILASNPSDADALNLLGVALHQTGRSAQALDCLRSAVKKRRKDPALHYNLGTILADCGDLAAAEAAFRSALKLGGRDSHLEMNLANAIALQGRLEQALPFYQAATVRAPRSASTWFNYGNALRDMGESAQALDAYRKAVSLAPADTDGWINLGHLLHRLERIEEAEAAYREALRAGASDAEVYRSLAHLLLQQARPAESLEFAQKALALQPEYVDALVLLGRALRELFRFQEGESALRRAVALDPDRHEPRLRLAELLRDTGRACDAMPLYDVMALAPAENPRRLAYSRAIACMHLGRFVQGWADMQGRFARERLERQEPGVRWAQGVLPEDLAGKTVYLIREQGLGDELFYLRFMSALRARGARVLYACDNKLQPLLERAQVADRVEAGRAPPQADFFLSVGDLPWALEAGIKCAPTPPALRLRPLPDQVQAMRARLAAIGPGPYIGVTWRAGTAPDRQLGVRGRVLSKTIDHRRLGAALAPVDATLIGLQRDLRPGEMEDLASACGRPVHDFSNWNEALDDALALQATLDDYVGVSNTNMHLRAGLGLTARVLLTYPADWRWIAHAGSPLFFPGFTLYEQTAEAAWDQALVRLRSDLRACMEAQIGR